MGENTSLDLFGNSLIIDFAGATPVGEWDGEGHYTGILGLVEAGLDSASDTEITSRSAGGVYALGVAETEDVINFGAAATALWNGEVVDKSSVLVDLTYGGDANLDGKLNIDDYGRIDFNVVNSGAVFGWSNGDFNYDGKINIDDYGIIDFNIANQGVTARLDPSGEDAQSRSHTSHSEALQAAVAGSSLAHRRVEQLEARPLHELCEELQSRQTVGENCTT